MKRKFFINKAGENGESPYQTLARNTTLMTAGTFGSKILVFLMVRFYTGYLTPADYGTADLITQTANLLFPVISLGMAEGVFRFAVAQTDLNRKHCFSTAVYLTLAGTLVLGVILFCLRNMAVMQGYAGLIWVYTAATAFQAIVAQYVRGLGDTALYALQGLVNTATVIVLNILFLAVFHMGIWGYVLSVVYANIFVIVLMVWCKKLWKAMIWPPEGDLAKQMLRYSVPLIPTAIFWWIMSVSDRYMVSAFIGNAANGIYAVAYKIPTILTLLANVFMEAWQISAVSEENERVKFYSKVWAFFAGAMLISASGIIVFAKLEIRLLAAAEYQDAWRYIPVLALAMVFSSFSAYLGSIYVVNKTSGYSFWTALLGAVSNVVLNFLLIPTSLGVQGAAIATMVSCFAVFGSRLLNTREVMPFEVKYGRMLASMLCITAQTLWLLLELPWNMAVQILLFCLLLFIHRSLLGMARQFVQRILNRFRRQA